MWPSRFYNLALGIVVAFVTMQSPNVIAKNICLDLFPENKTFGLSHSRHTVLTSQYAEIKLEVQKFLKSEHAGLMTMIHGLNRPSWDQYNNLNQLVELLENKLNQSGIKRRAILNVLERETLLADFREQITSMHAGIKVAEEKHLNDPQKSPYYMRFLDYHIAYFRLLERVNVALGVKLLFVPDLSVIKSDQQMLADAKAMLQRLNAYGEQNFHFLGYKDLSEYETTVAKTSDPILLRKLDIAKNQLVVSMHRPEGARFWVPIAGFQNQRITGTSNGSNFSDTNLDGTSVSGRDDAEAKLTNSNLQAWIPLSARFKPNYAEARPAATVADIKPNSGASGYGDDLWIIKQSVIEERGTWTPKDSLAPGWSTYASSYAAGAMDGIDSIFIPWKFRSLMTSYSLGRPLAFSPGSIDPKVPIKAGRWKDGSSYFEVQIFGPLTIDDVQAFHFLKTVPDKKFYDLLVAKGIEVWDERTWPAKRYYGEESK